MLIVLGNLNLYLCFISEPLLTQFPFVLKIILAKLMAFEAICKCPLVLRVFGSHITMIKIKQNNQPLSSFKKAHPKAQRLGISS